MTGHGLLPDDAWPILLAERNDWTLTNLAEDGAGFLALGDDGGTFADQADEAVLLDPAPDVLVVSASTNDIGEDPDDVEAAARSVFTHLRLAFPDARIIGLSAIWGSDEPDASLQPINDAVERAALAADAEWIDIGEPLLGRPDLMQDDGVHPTADGLDVMADTVEDDLEVLLDLRD
jgi:acyl-CoA thioesterase I